jgi:hypothetical protein
VFEDISGAILVLRVGCPQSERPVDVVHDGSFR